jgi:hypothetical protein
MPSTGKRVFANNQDITFHDYLNNKKGVEILKQIKSTTKTNTDAIKMKFLSYNDFMMLTKAFSKNSNIKKTDIHSMNDKTTGLIYYEKIISHVSECDYCKNNNTNIPSLLLCQNIKNIIYAYENNFSNTNTNVYQQKMDLNRWCKKCEHSFPPIEDDQPEYFEEIVEDTSDCECPQNNIKKISSGRRPIFCFQCDKFIDICLCPTRWGRVDAINRVNRKTISETYENHNKKALFINQNQNQNKNYFLKKNIF